MKPFEKIMCEALAWKILAILWDYASIPDGRSFPQIPDKEGDNSKHGGHDGLCHSIKDYFGHHPFYLNMIGKIPSYQPYGGGYCWRLDMEGAKMRAEFCRQQAALCEAQSQLIHADSPPAA